MKRFSLHWGCGIIEEEAQIETPYHRPTIQLLKFTSVQINGVSIDNRRQHVLKRGDVVLVRTPGAGGDGFPARRDSTLAERDRAMGYE